MTVSLVKERKSGSAARVSLVKRRGSVVRAMRLVLPGSARRWAVDVAELSDGTVWIITRYRPGAPSRSGFRRIGGERPWSAVRTRADLGLWETLLLVQRREEWRRNRPASRALVW